MMADKHDNPYLKQAYRLDSQQATKALYRDWAESYNDTMSSHDYQAPTRCAEALLRHLGDKTAPIFDIGCGTGISGQALANAGFTVIDGSDISDEMVAEARRLEGVYRALCVVSLENPFSFDAGYAAITAMGVIAEKHAPPEAISQLLNKLSAGGLLVFSLNNHTLENPAYMAACNAVADAGEAEILEQEMGPHIVKLGMSSRIMVLRRL